MAVVRSALIAACALLACAGSANAETAPAALFDAPGQSHAIHCASLGASPKPLRFSDATPTGFEVTDQFSFTDGRCLSGTVRLDLHEVIPSTAGPTVFHRGGNGYEDDQNVKYGHLAISDLAAAPPEPVPSSGGRGAPCELTDDAPFEVQVRSIPSEMKYKRPQDVASGNNSGASFMHYGDPGADQGDRDDIDYSYLVWSFVDVRGGGMVRTLLAPGQVVRLCDVQPITMDAWDRQGELNGQVTARYVQTYAGSCPVYGWMVWTHEYVADGGEPVEHAVPAASPPAPGTPDAACPVAPAASAPLVTTGGAAPIDGTSTWTLTGTANAKGVPTTFWFEYGVDSSYGTATPAAALSAAERVSPVSAPVDGLEPATTYHYRLVAASAHGTTYGPDQTLTTAAPPPPPAPARIETARVEPPSLSNLRVTPSAFKRTRSRRSSATRIRYTVSVAGTIKLTFLRAEAGMRVGSACRRPPRGGVPRGKRPCTRWVARGGALTTRVDAGTGQLRFGGWVGTRALPTGRYRLRAIPLDGEGRVGAARQASFRLR